MEDVVEEDDLVSELKHLVREVQLTHVERWILLQGLMTQWEGFG